jgi:aryl-alcohol dehydrogenase-like predicted oxidoreductase
MEYTTFGKTGLRVSVMGLGCGGHSRLGLARGNSEDNAIEIVQTALDLGINFLDTAEFYGTEEVVGKGIKGAKREDLVISTKKWLRKPDGSIINGEDLEGGLNENLKRLDLDYVDVYNLHGLRLKDYDYAVAELLPVMQKAKEQGKIRFIGVTEGFAGDADHKMLQVALKDNYWEGIMVGFNILNQTARHSVFPLTLAKGIGVQLMYAVRNALRNFGTLSKALQEIAQLGQIDLNDFDPAKPLGFLLENGKATSLTDASYRFCRYEAGIDVVLVGTGSVEHLKENAVSLLKPPLPSQDVEKVRQLFAKVDNYTGN